MAKLGLSDVEVPRLGLGAMTWGEAKGLWALHPAKIAYGGTRSRDDEAAAFAASVAAGVTLFDVAATYGGGAAEVRLGELARGRHIVVASKFPRGFLFGGGNFERELEGCLGRLGVERIDLYQHHHPAPGVAIEPLMERMAAAVAAGKIRAVGVSNYTASQMRLAHAALTTRGIPLASNQVEYSLLNRTPETNGVLDACRELGVTLIAYTPLASGVLSGKFGTRWPPAGGMRALTPRFLPWELGRAAPVVALLREIGAPHGKTPTQVALRWLIENPVVLPIPGAKTAAQAEENAGALGFALTADEVEALTAATVHWR